MDNLHRLNDLPPRNYADLLERTEAEKWELIEGTAYNMTPAQSTQHQRIVGRLFGEFYQQLKGKECEVLVAPFAVRLLAENKSEDEVRNIVQPDLVVVCDLTKVDEQGCNGSPDLIVEVLSPATANKDRTTKLRLYRKAEVKEYWIVDPYNETVEVYAIQESRFGEAAVYEKEDRVLVGNENGFELELHTIFG
ncbi:MAG TPA: Uma2 family endonuclease [Bacilli bacterium]|nr:Uma2 family endonuclease [Bacilli bacterium]